MIKMGRKGLVQTFGGMNTQKIILEWEMPNLVNVRGTKNSGKTLKALESIQYTNSEKSTLIFTSNPSHYKGIRTIEKENITVNDIKLVDDILRIYPTYKIVMFDHFVLKNKPKEFYRMILRLVKNYQDVLFIWITEESKQITIAEDKKTFSSEENVFFHLN